MPMGRSLEVHLAPELLRIFFPLFMEGVEVEIETGHSIKQLLTEQFGIAADYLSSRITTLFLDSRAVDNAATALVQDGAVLALSGAMPGLVGATLRSGGYYAAMRGNMTFHNDAQPHQVLRGSIKLKLFNLLLPELSPRLLRRGIWLSGARWRAFLAQQPEHLRVRGYRLDGRPQPLDQFLQAREVPAGAEKIKIQVYVGEESA